MLAVDRPDCSELADLFGNFTSYRKVKLGAVGRFGASQVAIGGRTVR